MCIAQINKGKKELITAANSTVHKMIGQQQKIGPNRPTANEANGRNVLNELLEMRNTAICISVPLCA